MDDLTFGQRLVHFRTRKHLLQKELAEIAGLTPTALNYYEKDKREPNVLVIKQLAKALGVTGDELLGFTNEDNEYISEEAKKIAMLYDKADDDDKNIVKLTLKKYDVQVVRIAARDGQKDVELTGEQRKELVEFANDIKKGSRNKSNSDY